MKLLKALMAIMIAVMVCSCSSHPGEKLLKTVPKKASAVTVANVKQMVKKMNLEEKDGALQLPAEMESMLRFLPDSVKTVVAPVLNGEAGVKYSAVVNYTYEQHSYLTFNLDDVDKFKSYLETALKTPIEKQGDGYMAAEGGVVVVGKQAWFTSNTEFDVKAAEKLQDMDKDRSFMGIDYAKTMLKNDADIASLVDFDNLIIDMQAMGDQERMSLNLALSLVYENPKYIVSYTKFEEGEIDSECQVLDNKFALAKTPMGLQKIDPVTVKNFPGNPDLLVAVAVDPATIRNLVDKYAAAIPSDVKLALEHINGKITIGINLSELMKSQMTPLGQLGGNASPIPAGLGVIVEFDSDTYAKSVAELLDKVVGSAATAKYTGSKVCISSGMVGDKTGDSFAPLVKDASFAAIFIPQQYGDIKGLAALDMVQSVAMTGEVEDGSLVFKAEVKFKDAKRNALLSLVKMLGEFAKDAAAIKSNFDVSTPVAVDTAAIDTAYDYYDEGIDPYGDTVAI